MLLMNEIFVRLQHLVLLNPTILVVTGFTEGALFANKHSPLLLSWITEGELYGDDLKLWEYIPSRNETTPFQYDGARSDPDMDLDAEDRHAYQKPEKRQGAIGNLDPVS
ncbi:hypothetical protein scyTo_0026618, partial [Scyliorhinus torazame]|nr:hypothetical protein [Scyliorhinus torazame]